LLRAKEENTAYDNNNFDQYGGHRLFMNHTYIYTHTYTFKVIDEERSNNDNTNANVTSNNSSRYNNKNNKL